MRPDLIVVDAGQMLEVLFLGLKKIVQQRAQRPDTLRTEIKPQAGQGNRAELCFDRLDARFFRIVTFGKNVKIGFCDLLDLIDSIVQREVFVEDDLLRLDLDQLIQKRLVKIPAVILGQIQFPGRYITISHSHCLFLGINRGQIIIFFFMEHRLRGQRSGRYHADHFPFDDTFGLCRIFGLFTDGDFVALFHKPGEITVGCVERDAAHRRPFLLSASLSGQCQF